jgi:hypothetical protein
LLFLLKLSSAHCLLPCTIMKQLFGIYAGESFNGQHWLFQRKEHSTHHSAGTIRPTLIE